MALDKAPGNLSRQLAGDTGQHFSVEMLEQYIASQKDLTPIHYLISRYMGDQAKNDNATIARVELLLSEIRSLIGHEEPAPVIAKIRARR
jgi:hypothetical protein